MLAELVNEISELAQSANDPKTPVVTEIQSGDPHKKRFLKIDGAIDEVTVVRPIRRHTVFDIDSLATWAAGKADGSDDAEGTGETDRSKNCRHVWHSEDEVVLVLDDHAYRENTVTMPLAKHPKFAALSELGARRFGHKDFINFIRLNLKAEFAAASPELLNRLRTLKFQDNRGGESVIQQGKESMGRQIAAEVTGANEIPEELTLTVPVWLHHQFTIGIDCALDVDPTNNEQPFLFRPKPGEIKRAANDAQAWLHQQLHDHCGDAVILFGTP